MGRVLRGACSSWCCDCNCRIEVIGTVIREREVG